MSESRLPLCRVGEPPPRPIALLGFGRSGTTWLADIVSKVSGCLILFEPLHPSVTELSRRYAYACPDGSDWPELEEHLRAVLGSRHRKPWLLRNHVPVELEQMSERWLETIWSECAVLGLKSIRANFMTGWLRRRLDARVLHIVRHPCAVVASLVRRKTFWEFGWPHTWELFLSRTMGSEAFPELESRPIRQTVAGARSDIERFAVMWSITLSRVLADAAREQVPVCFYEDLYRDPFPALRPILAWLGLPEARVHPAHVFTPSMTTLKTVHGMRGKDEDLLEGPSVFWRETLTESEVARVLEIAAAFGVELYDAQGLPRHETVLTPPTDASNGIE